MLQIARLRYRFKAIDDIRLPPFAGSAVRGVFGHSLKEAVCVTGRHDCRGCPQVRSCSYTALFETQLHRPDVTNAPHPLVFGVDHLRRELRRSFTWHIDATLIGAAYSHAAAIRLAWDLAGRRGFNHADFRLLGVEPVQVGVDTAPLEIAPPRVELTFHSPYRSKVKGRLVTDRTFDIQTCVTLLLRRIENLRATHDPDSEPMPVRRLIDEAASLVTTKKDLRWTHWQRSSSRQKTHMKLEGLTGTVVIQGDGLAALVPWLELGQYLHAGKNTLFGLGRYTIRV